MASRLMALLVTLFAQLTRALGYLTEQLIKIVMHLYDAYVIIPLQVKSLLQPREGTQKNLKGSHV